MSFESVDLPKEITREEAGQLYDSLPEEMKTGYYGREPEGVIYSNKQDAGHDAIPHIVVTFADGRKISLHLSLKIGLRPEEQAKRMKELSQRDRNIGDVQLMWQPSSE